MIKRACSACVATGTTLGVLLLGAPAFAQSGTVSFANPALHAGLGKAAVSGIYLPQDHHRFHHVVIHHHIIRHHVWDVSDVNGGYVGGGYSPGYVGGGYSPGYVGGGYSPGYSPGFAGGGTRNTNTVIGGNVTGGTGIGGTGVGAPGGPGIGGSVNIG